MTRNTVTDPGAKATTDPAMCASWLKGERDRRAVGDLVASADHSAAGFCSVWRRNPGLLSELLDEDPLQSWSKLVPGLPSKTDPACSVLWGGGKGKKGRAQVPRCVAKKRPWTTGFCAA